MIKSMENADSPSLADWFAVSLRWLILIGLTISLGLGSHLGVLSIILLSLIVLFNGFVTALTFFNRRLPQHHLINVVFDVLSGLGLFYAAGGIGGALPWAAVLPVTTTAVYFELNGALLAAGLFSLLQAGIVLLFLPEPASLMPLMIGAMLVFNGAASLVSSALITPFLHRLRKTYLDQVKQRNESEHKAQRLERERMRALFSMIETFSGTLNYQTVLETALETGVAALGASGEIEQTVGAVLLFGEQDLEIKAARHFYPRDMGIGLPG